LGRKKETRPDSWKPKRTRDRLLVVVDAEETEKQYLEHFNDKTRYPTTPHVKVHPKGDCDPLKIVKYAHERFTDDFTEAWCVFDQDDYLQGGVFDRAVKEARKRTNPRREPINLAVSVPCFELWLLLHHRDWPHDMPLSQGEVYPKLKAVLPHYKKNDVARRMEPDYLPGLPEAIRRSEALDERHGRIHQNPSTGMAELIRRLSGLG
jgi:hypothetical protein